MNDEIKARMVANIVSELYAPTPEQIAEWRDDFTKSLPIGDRQRLPSQGYASFRVEFEWRGYLRRCTEQAAEIAALKPLARFGALTMASRILMNHDYGTIDRAIEAGLLSDEGADGLVLRDIVYKPNIEATIEQLLKD